MNKQLRPGLKFSVKNPYQPHLPTAHYSIVRVDGNQCLCEDTQTRQFLVMPKSYVIQKINQQKQKK
jgi:hypothetical protein